MSLGVASLGILKTAIRRSVGVHCLCAILLTKLFRSGGHGTELESCNAMTIGTLTEDAQEATFTDIIADVEGLFGVYSPTGEESRKGQLRKLLRKCSILSRQRNPFAFYSSQPGAKFCTDRMTFHGGEAKRM